MITQIPIKIKIGNSQLQVQDCPTVVSVGTPFISWELPAGVEQRRFNLRMKSLNTFAEFIYGETASINTSVQWPFGYPMNDNWLGAVHIEVLVSADPVIGHDFEYTSGSYSAMTKTSMFVYDTVSENIFNSENVIYRWRQSTDVNTTQELSYHLMVSKSPLFDSEIIVNKFVSSLSGSFVFDEDAIVVGETYFWKVRAYDGLDYSDWTKENGFRSYVDYPPTIVITNVLPLNNEYGDVLIEFEVTDLNNPTIAVVCTYSGGTLGLLGTAGCSLIDSLNIVPNGKSSVIWRSSRDEQLIEASDYFIHMQGYDGIAYGDTAQFGPFYMDNRNFGIPPGGIGAIEVEFMVKPEGGLVKLVENNYSVPHAYPLCGNMELSHWVSYQIPHAFPLISGDIYWHSIYEEGKHLPSIFTDRGGGNYKNPYEGTPFTLVPFQSILGVVSTPDSPMVPEEGGYAPTFTLDPNDLKADGYPKEFYFRDFSTLGNRDVYIKTYYPVWGYKDPDPVYGHKNWTVSFIGGRYFRVEVKNGLRGIPGNGMTRVGVPYYIKFSDMFAPSERDAHSLFEVATQLHAGKWQYIWGWDRSIWHDPVPYPILGQSIDHDAPPTTGTLVKKVWSDYLIPHICRIVGGDIVPGAGIKFEPLINVGVLIPIRDTYFSGYPTSESPGYSTRPEPPWAGDRGITFVGNITSPVVIESLRFLYLQQVWDAYNTIHWAATLGYSTKIDLEYTEYINETEYMPYQKLITTDTSYDVNLFMFLIKPQVWSTYVDTLNPGVFQEGKTYRFRIRLVDPVTNTFSSFVYSNKFSISHNTVNPVNVLSSEWEPWNKEVKITFRIDDTQGDNYDIYKMQYTSDGQTWHDIAMRDVRGNVIELTANKYGDTVPSIDIIKHQIIWDTKQYNLTVGNNYRVQIYATLSILKQGSQMPSFEWSFYPNTLVKDAETKLKYYLGAMQYYVRDQATGVWTKLTTPQLLPGQLAKNEKLIKDIKAQPPPWGVLEFYQDHDETKPIIDQAGYNAWMNTMIGGVTRAELLTSIAKQNDDIRNVTLPALYEQKDTGELITRRNMIKQGFYCNGYVDNNVSGEVLQWRVYQAPDGEVPPVGNFYESRYEVYYRVQLDFFDTFNSQVGRKPLRDVFYDKFGNRIQNITAQKQDIIDKQTDTTNYLDPDATDKPWTGVDPADSGEIGSNSTGATTTTLDDPNDFTTLPFARYTLPQVDLPGVRQNYYINPSYPSVTDTLPTEPVGINSFEYDYYLRLTAYNIITGSPREIPRNLITKVEISKSENVVRLEYLASADETMSDMKVVRQYGTFGPIIWEYSYETKTPVWENTVSLSFPTDRPTDGGGVIIPDDRINSNLTVEGQDRTRPWAIITTDHQYHLWFSKYNIYNESVMMQAMGKSSDTFGEYSLVKPVFANQSAATVLGYTSIYAPCVITDETNYYMWATAIKSSVNRICFTKTNYEFNSWTDLVECTGLGGCYYPSVLFEDNQFKMWCCKQDGGLSKIFKFVSSDGLSWTQQGVGYSTGSNLNSPCVIKVGTNYIMFFTEFFGVSDSRICSVYSTDGLNWTDYQIEISDGNDSNPCVVVDRYLGNNVLRMFYNKLVSGKQIIKSSILGDRIWHGGGSISIDESVVPTINGNLCTASFSLSENGLSFLENNSDLRVRLYHNNNSGSKNYLIQSEWRIGTDEDKMLSMTPNGRWNYTDVWKSVPYEGA